MSIPTSNLGYRDRGPDRGRLRTSARPPRRPPQVALGLASANFPQWSLPVPASKRPVPHGLTPGGPKRGLACGSLAQTLPKRRSPPRLSRTRPPRGKRLKHGKLTHKPCHMDTPAAAAAAAALLSRIMSACPALGICLHPVARPTCFPAACPSACLHPNKAGVEYLHSYPVSTAAGCTAYGNVSPRIVSWHGEWEGGGDSLLLTISPLLRGPPELHLVSCCISHFCLLCHDYDMSAV
jgi:hypothetical protein